MKERGINFNGETVRAILEGRKTMTRRPVKNLDLITDWDVNDKTYGPYFEDEYGDSHLTSTQCPFGQVGDRLWVRETYGHEDAWYDDCNGMAWKNKHLNGKATWIDYPATMERHEIRDFHENGYRFHPSIHMPRWASRITLEITGVRVERVQDISEVDAMAEGMPSRKEAQRLSVKAGLGWYDPPTKWFKGTWDRIYGSPKEGKPDYSWSANPWVWVLEFKRVEGGAK